MKRWQGRVALVSGALRGIGLAISERCVAEGASVVLTDLAQPGDSVVSETLRRLGPLASYMKLDVASEREWH